MLFCFFVVVGMLYSGFVLLKFLEEGYFVWLTVVGFLGGVCGGKYILFGLQRCGYLEDIKKNPSKKLPLLAS